MKSGSEVGAAYVDTSCLVAILFDEPGGKAAATRLGRFDELFASNLLEAELMSVCARERAEFPSALTNSISWILPDRPLTAEISTVLAARYVRGADLWHLASALYLAEDASALAFMTLDDRQKDVARTLGFAV